MEDRWQEHCQDVGSTVLSPYSGVFLCRSGSLVNSLAAANQEVPKALVDLASKDTRFRKGLGSNGSGARGRGRGGAGRGRTQVQLLTTKHRIDTALPSCMALPC